MSFMSHDELDCLAHNVADDLGPRGHGRKSLVTMRLAQKGLIEIVSDGSHWRARRTDLGRWTLEENADRIPQRS